MKQKLGTQLQKKQIIIPGRWLYKIKHDSNGNTDKFKALYIPKIYKQIKLIEHLDTFVPTRYRIILLKTNGCKKSLFASRISQRYLSRATKIFEKLDVMAAS